MNELLKIFKELYRRHRKHTVFTDICEIWAITLRNAVDLRGRSEREKRYLNVTKKYNKEEMDLIAKMFGLIALELEREPRDVLGEMYMLSATNSKELGQFYTPVSVADLMTSLTYDKEMVDSLVKDGKIVKILEPACGSGVFPIAYTERMKLEGHNPQESSYVHATDIDITAVHMAYIQLSLLGIPGHIIHGNALTLETWDIWPTPFYILNPLIGVKLKGKALKEVKFEKRDDGQLAMF